MASTTTPTPTQRVTLTVSTGTGSDTLRACVAAMDASDGDASNAAATLRIATHARFMFHATRAVEYRHLGNVIPSNLLKEIRAGVWRDATGSGDAPDSATRKASKGLTSIGQYLSPMGKVASSDRHGLKVMDTLESIDAARASIKVDEDSIKSADETAAELKADVAYLAWRNGLPSNDRAAVKRVYDMLTGVDREHAAAFAAQVARHIGSPADVA